MSELAVAVAALIIGLMVGTTGIGGFLIIPTLVISLGLPIRTAVGTALVLGAVSGVLGVSLFARRGTLNWAVALPLVASAALMASFGGWVSQFLAIKLITCLLAAVIIAGSAAAYLRATGRLNTEARLAARTSRLTVCAIGVFSGLVAGITGAGGPVASIPLMIAFGFAPLVANGVGTVLQLVAGLFGASVYGLQGHISAYALVWSLPFQLLGIWLGVAWAHRLDQLLATRIVALTGLAAGISLMIAAFVRPAI